jgi:multiple sugar transport system substrate-binding protein
MIKLRGITWDHPRGYQPLAANVAAFTAEHPEIEVEWHRRSLRDFGVQPVEVLAETYDLLVIDHPFCGRARATGCLLDLRPLFPPAFQDMLERESVGPSTRSYDYQGGIWGLPTDAAAQVASYRPDLLARLDAAPPTTAEEVLALGRRARKAGLYLGLPSVASDSACLVASLAANLGRPIREQDDLLLPTDVFDTVLDHLAALRELAHPNAPFMNPIATYDAMSTADEIAYTPYGFSYVTYSTPGAPRAIRFANVAGPGPDPAAGAILGGAGCAISARCRDVAAAVEYLTWVHQPAHMAGRYLAENGQPGSRAAWTDPALDEIHGGFFSGTLGTMEKAWVRPRFDGFIPAFEHMGEAVHAWLAGEAPREGLIASCNSTYARASQQAARA